MVFLVPALAASFALVGCGDDGGGGVDPQDYYDGEPSVALGATTNQASCATCHSNDGTQNGYSGNTFADIAYHDSFKGDNNADLLGAVNACVTGWMGGVALTAQDEAYLMLKEYMESLSSPDVTAANVIAPEVLDDQAAYEAAYGGGDAAAGAAKYAQACARCHDSALTVWSAPAPSKAGLAGSTIGRIAQKVRTSGPPPSGGLDVADSTPGPMPFFEIKDLSAQDLADIIAYIKG
jgi:mono/diheme cytochrome c family protein